MISFWALITEDADSLVARLPADDAIALAGGFVPTLVAEPIAFGDVVHWRAEAVGVVTLVASVAQQQLVLLVAAVAKLAAGLHDRLVPRHRRFQHVEAHRHLGGRLAAFHGLSPSQQSFGRLVGRARAGQDALNQIAFALSQRSFQVASLDGQLDAQQTIFGQIDGIDSFVFFFFLILAGRPEFQVHLASGPRRQFPAFDLHAGRSYAILQRFDLFQQKDVAPQ